VKDVEVGKAIIDNMRLYPKKPDPRQLRMF
jgi:hypothetical protein